MLRQLAGIREDKGQSCRPVVAAKAMAPGRPFFPGGATRAKPNERGGNNVSRGR
jgi:hypothetical protein